jgi:hypothetical protein
MEVKFKRSPEGYLCNALTIFDLASKVVLIPGRQVGAAENLYSQSIQSKDQEPRPTSTHSFLFQKHSSGALRKKKSCLR